MKKISTEQELTASSASFEKPISYLACLLMAFFTMGSIDISAGEWHVSTRNNASDTNPGTRNQPFSTVRKALSLVRPGDTVTFSAGTYTCMEEKSPDGRPGLNVTLRSANDGKVIFSGDGSRSLLMPGSHTLITGIEFNMSGDHPKGSGINIIRKENIDIYNCRFFACNVGVNISSAQHITIQNCEMAFCGTYGTHLHGSGGEGVKGHWDPADQCAWVEVRNCWMHDAGWNIEGTEGYGITSNGAVEYLLIENCQFDNNTGDGILYEDWAIHTTARYNVVRGSGIAGIWIDNASMSVFDNNFLYGNNVAIWLSGEESSNRHLSDMVSIRNNIIVHNDWTAIDTSVYGKITVLFSQNTRDLYFDNNTVAFNNCKSVVGFLKRPPLIEFRNIWFRNNIFWNNTGEVSIDSGIDTAGIHFVNNLWNKPYHGDLSSRTGDPLFVDPNASTPDGYRLKSGSAAADAGLLLYENPLDFWNGKRPHLPGTGTYDIGAHESGTKGSAHIGLDLTVFPFKVTPYKLQFKAKPVR